jgi:hypothetical protein
MPENHSRKNGFIIIPIFLMVTVSCTGQTLPPLSPQIIAPTFVIVSTPTATPIPTEVPPTVTMTSVPGGPCDNPLVPLAVGNEWQYLVTGVKDPYQYLLKVGERADIGNININIEMIDQKHKQDIKELVVCREGAIDNFPLHVMSMLLADYLDRLLNTYKQSGQYAPAYLEFARNNWTYAWQSRYLVEETVAIKDPAGSSALFLTPNNPIDVSFKTEGKSVPVTVPGGSFPQALLVENDYSMPVTVVTQGISTSGTLVIKTEQWYVPFVGLVRARVDSASVSIMPGQEASVPIQSVLELIEFTPGK